MIELLEGEKIILATRKHWLVAVIEAGFLLVLGTMPLVVLIVLAVISPDIWLPIAEYWEFVIFYTTACFLFSWLMFYIAWTNYYLDVFLVTNKRVIDIEQFGLFSRDVVELRLEDIQDIKVEV